MQSPSVFYWVKRIMNDEVRHFGPFWTLEDAESYRDNPPMDGITLIVMTDVGERP